MKYSDLLGGHSIADVEIEIQHNLEELYGRLILVEKASGIPFVCTSGLRFMQDHLRIYSKINAKRKAAGLPELRIPMASKHLKGKAADISDPLGKLMAWCKANEDLLIKIGLWCEEPDDQKRVHFQTEPYGSYKPGKTIFFKA